MKINVSDGNASEVFGADYVPPPTSSGHVQYSVARTPEPCGRWIGEGHPIVEVQGVPSGCVSKRRDEGEVSSAYILHLSLPFIFRALGILAHFVQRLLLIPEKRLFFRNFSLPQIDAVSRGS